MRIKIIINKILIVIFLFFICLIFSYTCIVLRANTQSNLNNSNEKIYTNVSLDEYFDDASVLVVMNKSISEVNKEYSMEFFGDFPKESIVDLTFIPGGVTENTNINLEEFTQILQIKLPIHSKQNVLNVIKQLEDMDEILWVGPNHIESAEKQPITSSAPSSEIHRYTSLWGLHDSVGIQVEQAWAFTTGNDNIRVGVIDSGMFNHNDISGNISTDGGDFVNMIDYENNIPGPLRTDPNGHGTHVSGIIGATGTNSNGVTGVALNVELVPLQVSYWNTYYSDWKWDISAVTRAITWAMYNDIDIINYSGGGTNNNIARRNAMNNFNGLFVVAAGNGGSDGIGDNNDEKIYYPSDYSRGQEFSGRVISVGAYERVIGTTTNNVARCNFSNFGKQSVTIFAPGRGILSTLPTSINSTGYGSWDGTSMATPHVTGTAVLLWDILENSGQNLTQQEIAERIKIAIVNSAVTNDVGTPLNNLSVSCGRLNAYNALKYVLNNYGSSTTLKYNSTLLSKSVDSTSTYFNEKNYFLKMSIENAYTYDFIISSSSALEVKLYDSNFNEITISQTSTNEGLTKTFSYYLSVGTYYLKTNYVSSTASGIINVSIAGEPHTHTYEYSPAGSGHIASCVNCGHTTTLSHVYDQHYCIHCNVYTTMHDYDRSYEWVSYTMHSAECCCGAKATQGHAVSSNAFTGGKRYAPCLICGGLAERGFIQLNALSVKVQYVTDNGSYILPNGVIVLVDKDIELYLNGTLEFHKKDSQLLNE